MAFGCTNLMWDVKKVRQLFLSDDIHVSPAGIAFVKSNVRRGLVPTMLEEILNTRIMVKKRMKTCGKFDKNLNEILDARQLGLKLIANVTYGYTSANFSGRMPCVEVADSIVHKGRETLERAIEYVDSNKDWNVRVVYGDTDSLFILAKGRTKEQAFELGDSIAAEITRLNPKPVKLKFEKIYYPSVLLTKKRYVGYAYESLSQQEPIFDAKGIETVRRDSCGAVSKIMEKSLHTLFRTRGNVESVQRYVVKQFDKILSDRLSVDEFIFAKEYRGRKYYSINAAVPALYLARQKISRDPRSEPKIKERVPYVIVNGLPGNNLISCVKDPLEIDFKGPSSLNYHYYITKQIGPALNRVLVLLGADCLKWYSAMPRRVRYKQRFDGFVQDTEIRSRCTLTQYFLSAECPLCGREITLTNPKIPSDLALCQECLSDSQNTSLSLSVACLGLEQKRNALSVICRTCVGCQAASKFLDQCQNLDCPVFCKKLKLNACAGKSQALRRLLAEF